ncbi:MAG: hypothetical protein V1922_03720 [bacterium]
MSKKRIGTFSVYIYNSIEDEWDFISSFKKSDQKQLIHDSNRFADCSLFVNTFLSSFTLISPISIGLTFKEYFEKLSGTQCTVLTPKAITPFMCDNIAYDEDIFSVILSGAIKAGSLTLYAYAMTQKVFDLKKRFEKAGVVVFIPEAPAEKDLWTVAHYGSKSGFRASFAPLMPTGSIELDYKAAQKNALFLFGTSPGIVLKTDKGNAGQGVHIFRKNKIKTKERLRIELQRVFDKETYLKKHPLILETYINTSKEKKSPYPSIECFIHQNGKIELPYYCNMIVTPEGEFYGMEMHRDVFTKKVKKDVIAITMKIAKTYRNAGYRGRFDIDMINDGKKIYANESNTRTTGGTDTYYMVKKIVGKYFFSQRYVLSSYMDLPARLTPSFSAIKQLFIPYLFSKKTKTGLIINSESVIKNGGFSYILVEKNKKKTLSLHKIIKKILTNRNNQ